MVADYPLDPEELTIRTLLMWRERPQEVVDLLPIEMNVVTWRHR